MRLFIGILVGLFATTAFAADQVVVKEGKTVVQPSFNCPLGHTAVAAVTDTSIDSITVEATCAPIVCGVWAIENKIDKIPTYGPVFGLLTNHDYEVTLVTNSADGRPVHKVLVKGYGDKVFKRKSEAKDYADELMANGVCNSCLLYTSPSPRDRQKSRMPSSA